MCLAQNYVDEHEELIESEENGEIEVRCDADYWGLSSGFVFRDGSIIDIGYYEDHRIIDIDDWLRYNMVSYRFTSGNELDIRINGTMTWAQAQAIASMANDNGADIIYIDVYNYDDKLAGSLELSGDVDENSVWDAVFSVL